MPKGGGDNQDSLKFAPSGAEKIYWRSNGYSLAMEFEIGEDDLLVWASKKGMKCREHESGEEKIPRYLFLDPKANSDLSKGKKEVFDLMYFVLEEGQICGEIKSNGSGEKILFDKKSSKAYYMKSSH